ncbi:MAG: MMPL family transporter [Faecalibacterium sp.]|nr:MMPL family transporter [Faecalibacterium sp.]
MEKLARGIVKFRKLVLVVAVLLLIPSALGALATGINYDILTYLPDDLDSMKGEQSLENDFHIAATGLVTMEGLPQSEIDAMRDDIADVKGVRQVIAVSDLLDERIPADILPEELQNVANGKHDAKLMVVLFDEAAASQSTMNACNQIKGILHKDAFFGGMSMILENTRALVNKEMPWYIVCAVGASLLVLFLAMGGWVVPPLFMLGLVFPIVYNFGTNVIFGQISYITEALATVLQLGVTMDFSIFLLNRYREEKSHGMQKEEAMVKAIMNTGTAISASSLTTIAGFLALCTMELTLGRDIGLVMAKGVALGVICTVTILPSLLLTFDGAIEKYRHRTIIPKLKHSAKFVSTHYKRILAVFVVLFIPFAIAESKVDVYYTLFNSLPQDMTGILGTNKMGEDFGMQNTHFVLVSDSLSGDTIRKLDKDLGKIDGVKNVMGIDKFVGGMIPSDFIPSDVSDLMQAGGYKLILMNSSYENGTDAMTEQIDAINDAVKQYDPNAYVTGEAALTSDLIKIASVDFRNVSLASIIAVFLIIVISFKSISVPVLLVASIESAIYINMAIPYFSGTVLPFIASIVIGTVQLGATVDYAILMTTRFREEMQNGATPQQAGRIALENCSQSILTSGLTFFAATFGVSLISRMELLQSLCLLISRGALISMFVIINILPCLLILLEPVIEKTSLHWLSNAPRKAAKS